MATQADTRFNDYVVKDLGLADFGRKEIEIAETEMPGLMALREEYGASKPLKGARITGSLHMTIQTAVLIETLERSRRRDPLGLVQHLLDAGPCGGGDRGSRHSGLRHQGRDARRILGLCRPHLRLGPRHDLQHDPRRRRRRDDVRAVGRARRRRRGAVHAVERGRGNLRRDAEAFLAERPGYLTKTVEAIKGVSEETTTGVHRLYDLAKKGKLPFPAINVNDSVTKSKFDNLYGCKESLVDAIRRATDVMLAGKVACVAGFGDVGKGSAASLRNGGARVIVTEVDPICALQAAMEGYEVVTMEEAAPRADIFVTATGNMDVITLDHMRAMKNMAIVSNIGHFDSEIQIGALANYEVDRDQAAGRRGRVPGRQEDHRPVEGPPGEPRQCHGSPELRHVARRFTNQVLAQIELWTKNDQYKNDVYVLPKHLDEKVAALHLDKLGVQLTKLSTSRRTISACRRKARSSRTITATRAPKNR